jgi:hypothetical protein
MPLLQYLWNGPYLDELQPVLPGDVAAEPLDPSLLYLTAADYGRAARADPAWTSVLSKAGQFQVFRGNWKPDSDWLSLVTWNWTTRSNRDMAHHDQLGLEYYSHGDLLLADGGEVKHLFDTHYAGLDHNCLEIEDPRRPWPGEVGTERRAVYLTHARPTYKGNAGELVTAATVGEILSTSALDFLEARATIRHVVGNSWQEKLPLSSPIAYCRAILHVRGDYFIVFDDLKGEEAWSYSTVLRPTSQTITPTLDGTSERGVGHVHGDLVLGDRPYDWLGKPYKIESATGIRTSLIRWTTTNPFGRKVLLEVCSTPAAEVVFTKHTTRIAGYDQPNEVFSPKLRLRAPPAKGLCRLTALLSRYEAELPREIGEIEGSGGGQALRLALGGAVDLVAAGDAGRPRQFAGVATDGAFTFVRRREGRVDLALLVHGQKLACGKRSLLSASAPLGHAAISFADGQISGHVDLEHPGKLTLPCNFEPRRATYRSDPENGVLWSEPGKATPLSFRNQGGTLVLECPPGPGDIEVR